MVTPHALKLAGRKLGTARVHPKHVRLLRESMGLSRPRLAQLIGCNHRLIYRYESQKKGERLWMPEHLVQRMYQLRAVQLRGVKLT